MIKRQLHQIIEKKLNKGKALVILGARQTGKTTLIKTILHDRRNDSVFLNCDEPQVRELLTNISSAGLKQIIGSKKYLFIDEAQRVKNIGLTLKLITDSMPDKQLFVTGSSSLDVAQEITIFVLRPCKLVHLIYALTQLSPRRVLLRRIIDLRPKSEITNPTSHISPRRVCDPHRKFHISNPLRTLVFFSPIIFYICSALFPLPRGVIGNTSDSGSEKSRFEP